MKFTRIPSPVGFLFLDESGAWFQFASDPDTQPLRPVCPPDESHYPYSHGGKKYRAACEAIAKWKEEQGWGVTPL